MEALRGPHNIWRLIRTGATFERTGAMQQVLEAVDAPPSLRIVARILGWPFKLLGHKGNPDMPPLPRALTALGPAYIKFGQLLSTRPDMIGPTLAEQLRMLQDRLPPFSQEQAIATLEGALDSPIAAHFSQFDPPIAAASIAQVHPAILQENGKKVAVKILRPKIERRFLRDVDAFHLAASLIDLLAPAARRLRPRAVINHFESVVRGELDLRMEAAAASEFHDNTEDDPQFHVPQIFWAQSSRRVLVTEWVDGLPMGDPAQLRAAGIDMVALANNVIRAFLTHALRDGFFHADMHQGNLKLKPDGSIIALDFGIMGRIDSYTARVYAEILMGFLQRDYRRVAEVHFEAGYVPKDQDVTEFAQALRAIGEPIFGQGAQQISMARLLAHLFEVTERFGMQTQTQLILLQRTMVVVEGVARSLHPGINMWEAARPVVETYIRDNIGPKAMLRDLQKSVQLLARFGPELPAKLEKLLNQPDLTKAAQRPFMRWLGPILGLFAGLGLALLLI